MVDSHPSFFKMKMVHIRQTAHKMISGCLASQSVIYVPLEESPEHQAPQENVEPKNVPQENEEIDDTSEEDPEEVEPYEEEDSEEIELKYPKEREQNDEEDLREREAAEAQEENYKESDNDKPKTDKDLVFYRAGEYCSYGEGGNMSYNLREPLNRIGIARHHWILLAAESQFDVPTCLVYIRNDYVNTLFTTRVLWF
jgi:hypothetical protein